MSEIYVYQIPLPMTVKEMVSPGCDDDFTIYINDRLSDRRKLEAYEHALRHCNGDFALDDVQEIEKRAHEAY